MKQLMRILEILGMAMFSVLSVGRTSEFDYAAYSQTTLQEIIIAEELNHAHEQAEDEKYKAYIQLECDVFKYQVPCSYSNLQRSISEKKKNVIMLWMETLKIDLKLAALYLHEIQVTEGMRVYWIPVQEQIIPHIKTELVRNDAIELFIIFIGKVESEFVFIATEFEKSTSPGKNSLEASRHTVKP